MADKREIISALSADELMAEMQKLGLRVGPITPTTRKIIEKKLARARGENLNSDIEDICVISSHEDPAPQQLSNDTTDNQRNRYPISDNSFYYGVFFDRNNLDEGASCMPAVFSTKQEALDAVKKLKDRGARFKPFKTQHEAEVFSLSSCSRTLSSTGSSTSAFRVTDPASSFKSPKPQELVKFRKIIEKGTSQEFVDLVDSNPKYLISSGDTPVILQEGSRYNAMHVAAKENKATMCKLIVDTLESDNFWQNYLSYDKDAITQCSYERKHVLVDLYLNTPDKGNFETPLHFACKFGHIDVVEYLVSHPLTNLNSRNKYGETPDQVAGSRCSSQKSVVKIKDRITHLLQDNYYVPVFGSEGDATPPIIGKPWSPDIHSKRQRTPSYKSPEKHSPADPIITVRAYAGPMSPKKANEFHSKWKTPPSNPQDRKRYIDIKRSDNTRGLERIGRRLAHSYDVPWTEYWDFLGRFVDFATPLGLETLEEYFSTKQQFISKTLSTTPKELITTEICSTPASGKSDCCVFISDTEESPPHENIINKMTSNDETSPTFLHRVNTSVECTNQRPGLNAKSPLLSKIDVCDGSKGIHRADTCKVKTENLRLGFENLSISPERKIKGIPTKSTLKNTSLSEIPNAKSSLKSPDSNSEEPHIIPCKKNLFGVLNESHVKEDFRLENEVDLIDMRLPKHSFMKKSDEEMLSNRIDQLPDKQYLDAKLIENTGNSLESMSSKILGKGLEISGSQSSSVFESPEKSISCIDEQDLSVPDVDNQDKKPGQDNQTTSKPNQGQKKMGMFIEGLYPSKLDLDVLRALDGVTISRGKYPLVSQWRNLVMSHSSTVRESWPSPGSPLFLKRHKSMLAWSS